MNTFVQNILFLILSIQFGKSNAKNIDRSVKSESLFQYKVNMFDGVLRELIQ